MYYDIKGFGLPTTPRQLPLVGAPPLEEEVLLLVDVTLNDTQLDPSHCKIKVKVRKREKNIQIFDGTFHALPNA